MYRAETRTLVECVEGWLSPSEGELLYNLARNCTARGSIVEIGSWKGKSTIWLAAGSEAGKGNKVYAIDPHTGASEQRAALGEVWTFEEFKRNIEKAGVSDMVIPLVQTSEDAARSFDDRVELLFIDGAHEYELVRLDFQLWYPKLLEGGTIAFHDTMVHPGPKQVVKELVYKSKNFKRVRFTDSITYGVKVGQNSLSDRIGNQFWLGMRNSYEFGARLSLPQPIRTAGKSILKLIR